jgi:hypothetical protein
MTKYIFKVSEDVTPETDLYFISVSSMFINDIIDERNSVTFARYAMKMQRKEEEKI